jgi:hypothetical protein
MPARKTSAPAKRPNPPSAPTAVAPLDGSLTSTRPRSPPRPASHSRKCAAACELLYNNCIDGAVADLRVLCPGGDERPAQEGELALLGLRVEADDRLEGLRGDFLRGQNVRGGRDADAEGVGDALLVGSAIVAAAHGSRSRSIVPYLRSSQPAAQGRAASVRHPEGLLDMSR